MKTVRKYVAVFDYGEHKKGAILDKKPQHVPENAFVPVDVEVSEPLKHTPEGVNY